MKLLVKIENSLVGNPTLFLVTGERLRVGGDWNSGPCIVQSGEISLVLWVRLRMAFELLAHKVTSFDSLRDVCGGLMGLGCMLCGGVEVGDGSRLAGKFGTLVLKERVV